MNKLIVILAVLIGLSVLVWQQFFYDNEVTSGSKYNFDIGMTKNEALKALKRDYKEGNIEVVLSPKIELNSSDDILYTDVQKFDVEKANNMDIWQLRFDKSERNVLALQFLDGRLVKMTRYRRAFIP